MTDSSKGVSVTEPAEKARKKGGRRRAREVIHYNVDCGHINDHLPTPAHAAAEAAVECAKPEVDKAAAGNPVDHPHSPSGSYVTDRESAPLTAGHAAQSPGNNFDRAGRHPNAAGHPDFRNASPDVQPFIAIRGNSAQFIGQVGAFGVTGPAPVANLDIMPAAERAGLPEFRAAPSGNPLLANGYGTARGSATNPNGGHELGNVTSHAVANKGKTPLEIMRDEMRKQTGR